MSILGFISLVLLCIVFSSDSQKKKEAEKYRQESMSEKDSWCNQVLDVDLEKRPIPDYEAYKREVEESLLEIFGTTERVERFKRYYRDRWKQLYQHRIYMARRGKLSYHDARFGLTLDTAMRYSLSKEEERAFQEDAREFALWIDRQLKKHGIYETMYFGLDGGYKCPARNARPEYGNTYIWEPYVYPSHKCHDLDEVIRKDEQHRKEVAEIRRKR